ncbi:putative kinesin [Trypanosoma grayi]|uniref:putative kinesin n=1 Tax=Trypanosoma grayi TaxID=71804 RepID=UPI0004F4226E|nr:putative kinesin [Trypanosoma grayi]KEG12296.1 putative kinesin [Trypanosoma grayi]
MASETSAVLVAVRVRPFSARESALECTLTVSDARTVTLTDVGGVSVSNGCGSGSGQQHVFTFDKIFWSVPPQVLPVCGPGGSPATWSPRMSCVEGITPSAMSRTASAMPGMCCSSSSSIAGGTDSSVVASRLPFSGLPCFARVPEHDDQASVYAFIGPRMYESVMAGYNSCLFAYGQTGSGKTHSMMGPPDSFATRLTERGVIPRLCEDIFEMMRKEREEDESVTYNVECSFLEIYCERVRDLLAHSTGKVVTAAVATSTCSGSGATTTTTAAVSAAINGASSSSSSLRIRQHPTRGPYVEGLALVKVRDAEGVMRQLIGGMRERATAETRMNEYSSRSHAILQLHITRVAVVREETAVVTKTRVCKVNMVDLAGSERVSQSGATGERFEEARNINLSLTTLGRVILQLSDKQAGKHVVPAYRDSVLTWLLSDSLGGNSKTIMLATIAPSTYCYQQTLNTLRFAGVTKKVINVATVNEDRHFQKLIATLRQQIVKLTLQLEEGKAADVHHEEIRALRRDRDALEAQMDSMRAGMLAMVPAAEMTALQRRAEDLEEANEVLRKERNQLQRQLVSTTTALREELTQKRGEIMKLHEQLMQKDGEVQEWLRRHREGSVWRDSSTLQQQQQQQPYVGAAAGRQAHPVMGGWGKQGRGSSSSSEITLSTPPPPPPLVIAEPSRRREELERRIEALKKEVKMERQCREDVETARQSLQEKLTVLRQERDDAARQLEEAQNRLAEKVHALDVAQSDLAATRTMLRVERGGKPAVERERELAAQLDEARAEYLSEKETNVNLLLRVSKIERQLSSSKKEVAAKVRDITELEHLLLEETETSERYYLRLRYYRDVLHLAMASVRKSFSPTGGADGTTTTNTTSGSGTNDRSNGYCDGSAGFAWEQVVCGSVRDEEYSRALLEQECLTALLELLGQKRLLQDVAVAAANEELVALRTAAAEADMEPQRLRRKVEQVEAALEEVKAERLILQSTLKNSENARERLSREVEELTEQLEQQQQRNDALIAKIADVQSSQDAFDVRCGESDNSISMLPLDPQSVQQQRLERQVAQYQEEVGVLHAQLEKERNDKAEKTRAAQREVVELKQEMLRVRDDCKASLRESMQIVKDYEARVKELQDVLATLQAALEEESNNADSARDQMQRAEIARREAVEELQRVSAARDALVSDHEDHERRYLELQRQLHDLQSAYTELERRLLSMKLQESDVYLTVERGSDDDSWLQKAQREKEVLERQKQDVRRLNEELLAMVRQRNESLRAVDRQITKMQRGGVSPDAAEMSIADDDINDNPLKAQLRPD